MIEATNRGSPYAMTVPNHWRDFSGAVLIAGLLHLALVMLICLHGASSTEQEPQPRRVKPWVSPVLILLSFAYLAWALYRGGIQDYYFFIQMWREVQFGHDPWFHAYGAFGKYPMNAYGPLFNIFALPGLAEPALPEAPLRRSLPRLRQLADSGFLHGNSAFELAMAAARSLVLDALLLGRDRRVRPFRCTRRPAVRGRGRERDRAAQTWLRRLPRSGGVAQAHADRAASLLDPGSQAASLPVAGRRGDHDRC